MQFDFFLYLLFVLTMTLGTNFSYAQTPSQAPSFPPTQAPTQTPTWTPTQAPTLVPTTEPTIAPSTLAPSDSPTFRPSCQPSGQPTNQPSSHPSNQPSSHPTRQPTVQPSSSPSGQPTSQPSHQPFAHPSSIPSAQPSGQPTRTPSSQPTGHPTAQPSNRPSTDPTSQPTSQPSQPTSQPTSRPSQLPSAQPSTVPTCAPSAQPSLQPYSHPTRQPTNQPSSQPSGFPTSQPSGCPTQQPTAQPSAVPTGIPSAQPSLQPFAYPSGRPSSQPSSQPSMNPTSQPTTIPSSQPTNQPSTQPSRRPTNQPTSQPTHFPTTAPSTQPTSCPTNPTSQPSSVPSRQPTTVPTNQPSGRPTSGPTNLQPGCPAGQFYNLTGDYYKPYRCYNCPAGWYSDKRGSSLCKPCQPGYYSTQGATNCTICPAGQYSTLANSSHCEVCPTYYVTGGPGSFSARDCVNPIINFAAAGFALVFCGFVIFVYLLFGRFQRVAFQRQWRLTTKCLTLFSAMSTTADLVTIACHDMNDFMHRYTNETLGEALLRTVLKPMLYYFLVTVTIPLVTMGVVMQNVLKSLFKTMVLYRAYAAYNILSGSSYIRAIEAFLFMIDDQFFGGINFVYYLSYPFLQVVSALQVIKIDLPAVKVTCTGAQAPLYLLVDLVVLYVVIIVIEADYQVLWSTMIMPAMGKIQTIVFSRYYFGQHKLSTLFFVLTSVALTYLPGPSNFIQYALSWVSVSIFFQHNGRAESNSNCDNSVGIPLDSIYAFVTTVFAYSLFFPAVYLLSEVLVPSTKAEDIKKIEKEIEQEDIKKEDEKENSEDIEKEIKLEVSEESADPSAVIVKKNVFEFKINKNADYFGQERFLKIISLFSSLDWLFYRALFYYGNAILSRQQRFLLRPYKVLTYGSDPNHTYYALQSSRKQNKRMIQSYEDIFTMSDSLIKIRSRVISAKKIPSLPWFDALESEDNAEVIFDRIKEKRIWQKVKVALPTFTEMCGQVALELNEEMRFGGNAICWFFPVQIMTKTGQDNWKRVATSYLAMIFASVGYWPDWVVEIFDLKKRIINGKEDKTKSGGNFACSKLIPLIIEAVSLRSEEVSKDTPTTISKVDRFGEIATSIYGEDDEDDKKQDAFVRIANDDKLGFADFLSATVSTRIALIQLFPVLTLASTILTDLASFPLLVSKEMNENLLPPRIDYNAVHDAITYINDEVGYHNDKSESNESKVLNLSPECSFLFLLQTALRTLNPFRTSQDNSILAQNTSYTNLRSNSKLKLQEAENNGAKIWLALFLSIYLFLGRSRSINYILTLILEVPSVIIAFKTDLIVYVVPITTSILLVKGVISGIFVSILIQRLFFRKKAVRRHYRGVHNEGDSDDDDDDSSETSNHSSGRNENSQGFEMIDQSVGAQEIINERKDDEQIEQQNTIPEDLPDPQNAFDIINGLFWSIPINDTEDHTKTTSINVAKPMSDYSVAGSNHQSVNESYLDIHPDIKTHSVYYAVNSFDI